LAWQVEQAMKERGLTKKYAMDGIENIEELSALAYKEIWLS